MADDVRDDLVQQTFMAAATADFAGRSSLRTWLPRHRPALPPPATTAAPGGADPAKIEWKKQSMADRFC
ncbi:MAG: hypothetical protein R3F43_00645 [bacterium]